MDSHTINAEQSYKRQGEEKIFSNLTLTLDISYFFSFRLEKYSFLQKKPNLSVKFSFSLNVIPMNADPDPHH